MSLLLFYQKWFWEDPKKVHVAKYKGHFTISILLEISVLDFSQATLCFPVHHKPWASFFQSFMIVVINTFNFLTLVITITVFLSVFLNREESNYFINFFQINNFCVCCLYLCGVFFFNFIDFYLLFILY